MRKILYSPGYGAGWTSWESNIKLVKFMLEYKPFIDFIEGGGAFHQGSIEMLFKEGTGDLDWPLMEKKMHPLVLQFAKECYEQFKVIPFLGGLDQIKVAEVRGQIRIHEYDGYESIEELGEFNKWL